MAAQISSQNWIVFGVFSLVITSYNFAALGEPSLSQNIPSRALTRCIKLRGINFSDR